MTDPEQQALIDQRLQTVVAALGHDFVSHALNLEASSGLATGTLAEVRESISGPRQSALEVLAKTVDDVESEIAAQDLDEAAGPSWLRRQMMRTSALCFESPGRESLAERLYRHCGGTWPDSPIDDQVVAEVYAIGKSAFAASLLPQDPEDAGFGYSSAISGATYANAKHAFYDAWLADTTLTTLFPRAAEQQRSGGYASIQSELVWSNGSGGSLQLAGVPHHLIGYAMASMRLEAAFTPAGLLPAICSAVARARTLAAGEVAKVPVIASLSNVIVEADAQTRGTFGSVILPDERILPHAFQGFEASAIVSTAVDLKLLDVLPDGLADDAWLRRMQHRRKTTTAARGRINWEVDRLRLGMVLASGEHDLLAPVIVGQVVLNPLGQDVSAVRLPSPSGYPFPQVTVDKAGVAEINHWFERVAGHPESMWLGARRLLRAVTDREDPLDGFIDAVVSWENMLGPDQGETTFRLCASLATLLEPENSESRRVLHTELNDLYRKRSKLIHGSREPDPADAEALRDRSVRIAISAMKRIYENPSLKAASSEERSKILLLGA